jgi:uncharacterized protein YlzI (FlbEa/FlbD family)
MGTLYKNPRFFKTTSNGEAMVIRADLVAAVYDTPRTQLTLKSQPHTGQLKVGDDAQEVTRAKSKSTTLLVDGVAIVVDATINEVFAAIAACNDADPVQVFSRNENGVYDYVKGPI